MSEKDRFDWNDEADFESLADEPIEGFADFEDLDDYEEQHNDLPAEDADAVSDRVESEAAQVAAAPPAPKVPTPVAAVRGRGISSAELGILFSTSIVVAAAGLGSACLLAVGVNPASLWQPAEFTNWANYTTLTEHPLNILALSSLAVVVLALLGSRAVARAARNANKRALAAEEMLDRVTSLRLENEGAWQDPVFKSFGPASTFVSETLGAWRLQAARQKHFTGLEGELHRLEKALSDRSRQDLTGRFDNPTVGSLSDAVVSYYDERERLVREVETLRRKDQDESEAIVNVLQDARFWHEASRETLGRQGAALERVAGRLESFAAEVAAADRANDHRAAVAAFREELDRMRTSESSGPDLTRALTDLVDKGSKLAFQIAMEVARLGQRGERLVPMSQSLEDLTTEFRKVADQLSGAGGSGKSGSDAAAKLGARFSELEEKLNSESGAAVVQEAERLAPAAGQLARNLSEIVQSYEPQAERLTEIGRTFSEFSGAVFDPGNLLPGTPENKPAGVLDLADNVMLDGEGTSPEDSIHQPADVDPFAVKPPRAVVEGPSDPGFTSSVGQPAADIFGSSLDRTSLPAIEIESSFGVKQSPFAVPDIPSAVAATPFVEPQLPVEEEKVYDLGDFGAEPAGDGAADPQDEDDGVYDLAEFDATPLAAPAAVPESAVESFPEPTPEPVSPVAAVAEEVLDLADFGAVRLDEPAAEPAAESGERIYDLNELGAVLLT